MKGDPSSQRTTQALQPFRHLGTPVEDDAVVAARRQDLVPLIGSSIRAASVRRIRWQRGKKALAAAAVAAGLALLVAQGQRLLTNEDPGASPPQQAGGAVLSSSGAVALTRQGRPFVPNGQPQTLLAGDQITTPVNTQASLVLIGGARAEIAPSTQISLSRSHGPEQRLKLTVGRIELEVPKLEPGSALVVETPHAEVRVRGTRFSVEVSSAGADTGSTRVGVSRGSVLVRTPRGERLLSVGETWSSVLAAATRPVPAPEFAEERGVPDDRRKDSRAALSSAPDAHGHSPRPATPFSVGGALLAQRAGERGAADSDAPSRSSEPRPPTPSRQVEATPARSSADSDALARQNSLMQAALAARSRGDHAHAVRLLDELLQRHPSTPLAESARVERFRSLRRMGRHAEATREARRYLASYGRGFARDEARGLVLTPETSGSAPKR